MDRRTVVRLAVAAGAGSVLSQPKRVRASAAGARPVIAMLAYPGMFALDLVAPFAVFASMASHDIRIVWKEKGIVPSSGIGIAADTALGECPSAVDVLFVPGGAMGTVAMLEDPAVLDFVKSRAATARFVTSVCTGSLILASAGLLKGRRATSHWLVRDRLAELGAVPTNSRVVVDGNFITGAGVTAGTDLALTIAAKLNGEARAKAVQLSIEYDPDPPFDAGSPDKAAHSVRQFVESAYENSAKAYRDAIARRRAALSL